jgi:hypothetical protein
MDANPSAIMDSISLASLATSSLSMAASASPSASHELTPIARELAPFVRETLRYLRGIDEGRLDCATWLVAAGIFFELPEIIFDLFEIFSRKHFDPPEIPDFERHARWKKLAISVGLIGWFVVIAGVAGELVFESKVNTKTGEIESISDDLLRTAQIETGNARKAAIDAADAAADALNSADKANADLKEADEQLASVKKEADALTSQLSEASARLDDVQKKMKGMAPRVLSVTGSHGKSNIDPLKPYVGTVVLFEAVDQDAARAADTIGGAVTMAHWIPGGFVPIPKNSVVWDNVVIEYPHNDQKAECAALALTDLLKSNDWTVDEPDFTSDASEPKENWEPWHDPLPKNTIRVVVGRQTNPNFPSPDVEKINKELDKDTDRKKRMDNFNQEVSRLNQERRDRCSQYIVPGQPAK